MVEYYPPAKTPAEHQADAESCPDSPSEPEEPEDAGDQDEDIIQDSLWPGRSRRQKNERISEILAEYGHYARSMKPRKGWLHQHITDPKHIVINISESGCGKLLSKSPYLHSLIIHAQQYIRRIYPDGTRIESSNLDPLRFWRSGAHIASLNWQVFDQGLLINEALFLGTKGWALRPQHLIKEAAEERRRVKLEIEVSGISSLPPPNGKEGKSFKTHLTARLFHANGKEEWHTKAIEAHDSPSVGSNVIWDEQVSWELEMDELSFVFLTVLEHEFGSDGALAVFCARVDHLQQGWKLLRMLNLKGKDSGALLLARFALTSI